MQMQKKNFYLYLRIISRKFSIYALYLLVWFALPSKAQPYHPLLNNACWYEVYSDFSGTHYFYYNYYGDTVFNSMTYKKYRPSTFLSYLYLLREDSALRKVFMISCPFHDSIEYVLYDFSLMAGDTFTHRNFFNIPIADSVVLVDSIFTNVGYRKRWTFNNIGGPVVEQVGSLEEPVLWTNSGLDPSPTLICNYNGPQFIYFAGAPYTCAGPCSLGGLSESSEEEVLEIAPIPANDRINIRNLAANENYFLEIYNPCGKIVYKESFLGSSEIHIHFKLASGIYFVRLFNSHTALMRKLVIE